MARLLVEPPRLHREYGAVGCTGFTMEDGRVFRSNKAGHVEVDDAKTIQQVLDNPAAPGHVLLAKFHGGGVAGAMCSSCGFGAFAWQASAPCPRCGGAIEKEESK